MKKIVLACLLIFGLSQAVNAAEIALDTYLYESFSFGTASSKAGTSTLTTDTTLDKWIFFEGYYTLEGGDCRYRVDNGTPTASEGHLFGSGTALTIQGLADCRNFKAIGTAGTVTIRASYSRK